MPDLDRKVTVEVSLKAVNDGLSATLEKNKQAAVAFNAAAAKGAGPGTSGGKTQAAAAGDDAKKADDKIKGLSESINRLGGIATRAFIGTGAAITGFAAAASPDAMATFTGSIHLFAGEVGMAFIPAMNKISGALQSAAGWFRGLSESTKGTIATVAFWTLGVSGAVMVTAKLAYEVIKLGPVFSAAAGFIGKAFTTITAFAFANPIVAGIALIAVAVGALAYAFSRLAGASESSASAMSHARTAIESLRGGGQVTEEQFGRLPARLQAQLRAAGPGGVTAIAEREAARLEGQLPALEQGSQAAQQARGRRDLELAQGNWFTNWITARNGVPVNTQPINRFANAAEQAAVLRGVASQGVPGSSPTGTSIAAPAQILNDASQLYDAILIASQQGDLQARLADQAARGNDIAQGTLERVTDIANALGAAVTQLRPGPA